MTKAAMKWIKFYPANWLGDPGLRACSIAARGLWIDMLCLMANASPYGHLKLGRKKIDPPTLATLTGTPPGRVEKLLDELQKAGVFSLTSHGTIYSRRMVREEKWRRNGKKASAIRWSQDAENEEKIEKRINGSMTIESKNKRIAKSLPSSPGVARAKAREPPDYSKDPVEPSEALMRSRLVRKYTH